MLRNAAIAVLVAASTGPCIAQTQSTDKGRDIPGYFLPVPDDVSPQMRALVAAPPAPWDIHPKDIAEWKALVTRIADNAKAILPGMRQKLGVSIEPTMIGGVKAFILTPQTIAPENQNRVFLHFHGGAYVLNPGEAGTREGMLMAAFGRAKVISVDYRTSSDAPYPAALDDCVAVYRELLKTTPPQRIAVFGTSTGAGSRWRSCCARSRMASRCRRQSRPDRLGQISPKPATLSIRTTSSIIFRSRMTDT